MTGPPGCTLRPPMRAALAAMVVGEVVIREVGALQPAGEANEADHEAGEREEQQEGEPLVVLRRRRRAGGAGQLRPRPPPDPPISSCCSVRFP